jgi:hypothetical protein
MKDPAAWLKQFFPVAVLAVATGLLAQQIPTAAAPNTNQTQSPATNGSSNEQAPALPQNAPAAGANAAPITVQGCVNGGKQGFTLMQQNTGAAFELQTQSYKLKNMRGKLVQVTGREMAPNAKSHGMPQLQVEGLEVISDHCVLPGKAAGASTSVPQDNTNQNKANPNGTSPPDPTTPKYQSPGAPNQTPPSQGNNPTNWGRTSGAPSPGTGNPPPATEPPPKQ